MLYLHAGSCKYWLFIDFCLGWLDDAVKTEDETDIEGVDQKADHKNKKYESDQEEPWELKMYGDNRSSD